MTVRFHPDTRREALDAMDWYEDRSPISAVALAWEIEGAVARIASAPTRYPLAECGTRRLILNRFPFNIYYKVGESESLIIAVAHQKRRPGYWGDR